MTTPAILKSNLIEKLGKDILLQENPLIKDVMTDLEVTRNNKRTDSDGIIPKYLYSSIGLLGVGAGVLLAHILKLPVADVLPFAVVPVGVAGAATSLALSVGIPMYDNYKHEETKNIVKDNVAKYAEKATPEDRVWLSMMTMEQFSKLTVVTMSERVKSEISKDIQNNSLMNKIKKIAESVNLYSETSKDYEKAQSEVYKLPRIRR